jgi:membrane-associated protease RseP (regulator of RpoE activity)
VQSVIAIGAGVLVLGVLILVHELGHFLAAKSVGIAVLRFSFGLGPRTPLAFRVGETDYCLSWVPFGGYVKMAGLEDEPMEGVPEAQRRVAPNRTFDVKPLWARAWVISAGVIMNALFAVLVYSVVAFAYGVAEDPATAWRASPHVPAHSYGPIAAIGKGVEQAADAAGLVVVTLKGLVLGQVSARDLGGPILIGQLSGQVAGQGLEKLLGLMAFLSMNLAVLNLLPVPVLDGGHLLFLLIEGARRRPLTLRQRWAAMQVGLFVLAGIMLLALSNDLMRPTG